jgi:hypothetical protein
MDTELADGHTDTAQTPSPSATTAPGPVAPGANDPDGPTDPETAIDRVDQLLDEVELALTRLDDGTYGRCVTCGQAIDDTELATRPTTRSCGECVGEGTAAAGPVITGESEVDHDPNTGPADPPSAASAD